MSELRMESYRDGETLPPAGIGQSETGETVGAMADRAEGRALERVAAYRPSGGRWVSEPWSKIRGLRLGVAAALAARGVSPGDRVAIVSATRFEWGAIDLGILTVGAVTVGVYPTSTPDQVEYILKHSGARLVFVENEAQRTRLTRVLTQLPGLLECVVIDGPEFARFLERGNEEAARSLSARVRPTDLATLVYTSGTTGHPKAVALSHRALLSTSRMGTSFLGATADDLAVSYLPMAHILTRVNYYGYVQVNGTAWYAESLEKVGEAWVAARPTMLALVPRVLEKAHAKIVEAAGARPLRRALFGRALAAGTRRSELLEAEKPVPMSLRLECAVWERLVYSRMKKRLGWERVRFALCGGAPLRQDICRFFHALGVVVIEGFGMTETASPICLNHPTKYRLGTVGRPLPGVDLKIAEDGEILVKTPGIFLRYEGDEAATRGSFDADGYFKTGDVGELDSEGYLRITDRKRDILITAGGKNVAPQNLEALVRRDPRVSQVVVLGDRRPYLVALMTLLPELRATLSEADATKLALEAVAKANASLAPYETIKRVRVLDEDLTVDNELLTATLKVRRSAVEKRYARLIEAMYAEPHV